jgi:hypothetical protein
MIENVKYEIDRLNGILRDKTSTDEEKRVAADMLRQYDGGIESYLNNLYGRTI